MAAVLSFPTRTGRTGAAADVEFLRSRCSRLQRALRSGCPTGSAVDLHDEDALQQWAGLLVRTQGLSTEALTALEDLYVFHARVLGRIDRGGVADISPRVEELVTALLIDRLQALTDRAVTHLL